MPKSKLAGGRCLIVIGTEGPLVGGLDHLRRLGKITPCFRRPPKHGGNPGERRQPPRQAEHGSDGTELLQRLSEQRERFLNLSKRS